MLFTDMSAELPVFTIAGRDRDHAARGGSGLVITCRFRKWRQCYSCNARSHPAGWLVAVAQFDKNALMLPYEVIGERVEVSKPPEAVTRASHAALKTSRSS
jgi:hypothetical protein